jgi:hypothetical protein
MVHPILFPSPDKKHNAALSFIGEIQPSLGYYTFSIDKSPLSFADRIFGNVCLWSPDSRFLSIQEWKEINTLNVPKFYLLLIIDVLTKQECVIASIESVQGNILPQGFIGESLMYTVIYYGQFGMTKNYESKFRYLNGWQPIK